MYIVSLSSSGLDDTGLAELISGLPERCIALMEDIDAAFHHGLSRESPEDSSTPKSGNPPPQKNNKPPSPDGNRVSLSGLLNALDGIGAQEGRLLFATTNKYSSLDPALSRPGRMDLHIEFKLASRFQAEELFKRFYAASSSSSTDMRSTEGKHGATSEKRENGHADVGEDVRAGDLIDLSDAQSHPGSSSSPSLSEKPEASPSERPDRGLTYVGVVHSGRSPTLSRDRIHALAAQFAFAIPERALSMASIQGFLMVYKTRPIEAVAAIGAWVEKELTERKGGEKGEGE